MTIREQIKSFAKLSPIILSQLTAESHGEPVHESPGPVVSHEHAPEDSLIDNIAGQQAIVASPNANDRFQLELRSGLPPASNTVPDNGLLLASVEIDSTGKGSAGIVNSGSAGHFRIRNKVGRVISQGKVGANAEMVMDNNVCVAGGTLAVGIAAASV